MASSNYSFSANIAAVKPVGWALLAAIVAVWLFFADTASKVMALQGASVYSYLEFSWYCFSKEVGGTIKVVGLAEDGRKGFTTAEQFIGNLLYLPLAFNGYHALLPMPACGFWCANGLMMVCLRIALFPLNIWTLEFVQDAVMKAMMGFNPAWDYTGDSGSLLGGAINYHHWRLWIALGIICECFSVPMAIGLIVIGCTVIHVLKARAKKAARA